MSFSLFRNYLSSSLNLYSFSYFKSCIVGFLYGYLIKNNTISLVNGVGSILQAFYIAFYLLYTPSKKKFLHQIIFCLFLSSLVIIYAFYETDASKAAYPVGYLASLASVIMFGSPLYSIVSILFINLHFFVNSFKLIIVFKINIENSHKNTEY